MGLVCACVLRSCSRKPRALSCTGSCSSAPPPPFLLRGVCSPPAAGSRSSAPRQCRHRSPGSPGSACLLLCARQLFWDDSAGGVPGSWDLQSGVKGRGRDYEGGAAKARVLRLGLDSGVSGSQAPPSGPCSEFLLLSAPRVEGATQPLQCCCSAAGRLSPQPEGGIYVAPGFGVQSRVCRLGKGDQDSETCWGGAARSWRENDQGLRRTAGLRSQDGLRSLLQDRGHR